MWFGFARPLRFRLHSFLHMKECEGRITEKWRTAAS